MRQNSDQNFTFCDEPASFLIKDDTLEQKGSANKISANLLAKKTFGHILEN